ncbi:MAG: hypothetical protein PUJ70_08655 [Treponema sp.]|nr:hypothetical protein [Treponema sp.]MDY5837143.1 hypothetical protein [Treponema sp.]
MKKILSGVLAITLCASVFADSSNSIDGTISVAGRGDMPSGLFGKAAGYLPGDTVSITNPTTGITLQILNLGTLDASDGVALLLSQESAEKLGVVEKSDTQVKLAPRSGYFDQSVSGAAVLSRIGNEDSPKTEKADEEIQVAEVSDVVETPVMENSTDVPVENIAAEEIAEAPVENIAAEEVAEVPVETESSEVAENSFLETKNAVEQASPAEVHPEEIMESAVAEEITSEDPLFDNEAASVTHVSAEDILVPEEPAAEIADSPVESEEVAEAPVEEAFEVDELSPVEMELAADESVPEVAAVEPEAEIEEEASPVEEVAETPVEEAFEADELSPVEKELAADESVPEVAAVEPEAEIEEEASPVEEVAEAPVEEAFEVDELSPVEKELAADESVPEVAAEENSVDEEVAEIPAESEVVAEAFEADELEPVANEIDTKESEPEVAAVETEGEDYSPIVLVPAEPVPAENTLEAVVEEKIEEVKPVMAEVNLKSFTDYIVDSENDLRKNSYYVQFATLGDEKNIESTINKYNKYPLILVPNGKGAYKIMVGPLTVDEFGAVQAKFKSFGYKDAFVKSK